MGRKPHGMIELDQKEQKGNGTLVSIWMEFFFFFSRRKLSVIVRFFLLYRIHHTSHHTTELTSISLLYMDPTTIYFIPQEKGRERG